MVACAIAAVAAAGPARAGDPVAGKVVYEKTCRKCHKALPHTERIGDANLPRYLANPKKYNPKTAMDFRGLKRASDIENVIAYIMSTR